MKARAGGGELVGGYSRPWCRCRSVGRSPQRAAPLCLCVQLMADGWCRCEQLGNGIWDVREQVFTAALGEHCACVSVRALLPVRGLASPSLPPSLTLSLRGVCAD